MEQIGVNVYIPYMVAAYGLGVAFILGYGLWLISDRLKNLKLMQTLEAELKSDTSK